MQSSVWAAYRAARGWEPRFLTFDDGRVALALLRGSPGLPGVEAIVRRGPAHRDEPPEVAAAWAVALAGWADDVGAREETVYANPVVMAVPHSTFVFRPLMVPKDGEVGRAYEPFMHDQ